jgi:hypothetical protein
MQCVQSPARTALELPHVPTRRICQPSKKYGSAILGEVNHLPCTVQVIIGRARPTRCVRLQTIGHPELGNRRLKSAANIAIADDDHIATARKLENGVGAITHAICDTARFPDPANRPICVEVDREGTKDR